MKEKIEKVSKNLKITLDKQQEMWYYNASKTNCIKRLLRQGSLVCWFESSSGMNLLGGGMVYANE